MTTPAEELRQASLAIKVRADCGPGSFWSALADWLDAAAEQTALHEAQGAWASPESYALKVARAYLGTERESADG